MLRKLLFLTFLTLLLFSGKANNELQEIYQANASVQIFDRENNLIATKENNKDFYAIYAKEIPTEFKNLILQKEDQYFYSHIGFNLISIGKNILAKIGIGNRTGASTIGEQLAKILLGNENKRTLKNKIKELYYSLSLELFNKKDDILLMYANSIYFGNRIQGLKTASLAYFNSSPENLTKEETLQLVSSINLPNYYNPKENENIQKSKLIANKLNIDFNENYFLKSNHVKTNLNEFKKSTVLPLELKNYSEALTIDFKLNELLRKTIKEKIQNLETKQAKNAAAIVIIFPENEIISLIGTPDQTSLEDGYQINMLEKERQIASTIKPFIYLKAFEKGMRPYTLIDDKEYKYNLDASSFFYPKNYNYEYNGEITAHFALSNSINIGALKTLEFVGLDTFNEFFTNDLNQKTIQNIESYGLGIAMGSLEMNLTNLAHIFTIFPNYGKLKNLKIELSDNNNFSKQITDKRYVQLINKILNDRKTGADQFGLVSNLNLPQNNYALKTGTSIDFKDSLLVGYTPDFLVAVWIGNADNSKTEGLTGQKGAGLIWSSIMDIMMNSKYNKNTAFDFSSVHSFGQEFGLKEDNFETTKNLLKDDSLILNLHNNDIFLLEENTEIKLSSKEEALWFINDKEHTDTFFKPKEKGTYKITAKTESKEETIFIYFTTK